jgi:hypothetical protein
MIEQESGKTGHEPMPDLPDGFQMTELGPLPKEWRVVRLGEVAAFGRNKTIQQINLSLIPFVPMSLLPEDTIYISQWEMRRQEEIRSGIATLLSAKSCQPHALELTSGRFEPYKTSVRVRQPERAKCLSREKVSWVDDNKQSDRKAD